MKKYSFNWNKFIGFSLIVMSALWGIFWSLYMILGAIEGFARAEGFTNVPSGGSIIMQYLYQAILFGIVGCVLLAIEVKEV